MISKIKVVMRLKLRRYESQVVTQGEETQMLTEKPKYSVKTVIVQE